MMILQIKCADPEEVDECRNYYGDLDFDKKELVRAGADPEAVGAPRAPAVPRTRVNRPTFTNTFSSVQLSDYDDDYEEDFRRGELLVEVNEPPRVPQLPPRREKTRPRPKSRPTFTSTNDFRLRPAPVQRRPEPVPVTTRRTTTTTTTTTRRPVPTTTRRPVPTTFTTRAPTPTNRFSQVTTPQFSAVTTSTGSPFKAIVDFAASPSSPAAPVEQAPII